MTAADEIRRVMDDWIQALRDRDAVRLSAHWAPGFVSFDLAPPLQHAADEMRRGLAEWLATWEGPLGYDLRDLVIEAGGDVAFARCLARLHGRKRDGEVVDLWLRATVCFRRIDGTWRVAHEHSSVPFHMDGSYRAAVDLAP